jgi:hypothetical protein
MKEQIEYQIMKHEALIFSAVVVLIAVIIGINLGIWGNNTPRVRHYECYSGGVLVVDRDYHITNLRSHPVDEDGDFIDFRRMQCVVTK